MLPTGKYLLADPCVFISGAEIDELLQLTYVNGAFLNGEFTLSSGKRIGYCMTDPENFEGLFDDQFGNLYSTMVGGLGVIALEDADFDENLKIDLDGAIVWCRERVGALHEFKEPFSVSRAYEVVRFGHVEIDTSYSEAKFVELARKAGLEIVNYSVLTIDDLLS